MAPFQNKMRLSTGAKGNVVNKKALVSMKGALKEHAKKNKVLEAALAEEQVKTAAMGKKARAFEIIARKGVSLAKTAYGERETARLIYGKARPYIAPKKVVMDADVAEAIAPLFKFKNVDLEKCEEKYQEKGKNARYYVRPVPKAAFVAKAEAAAREYRKGQEPGDWESEGEEAEGAEQEAGSETEEE